MNENDQKINHEALMRALYRAINALDEAAKQLESSGSRPSTALMTRQARAETWRALVSASQRDEQS